MILILYALPVYPQIPCMRGIFFFGTGAFFSLSKIEVIQMLRKIRIPSHIISAATLLLATFNNASANHEMYLRLFYPFGAISFLNIMYAIAQKEPLARKLSSLSGSVFFIYAVHEIYILGWTKGICLRILGETLEGMYIRYFIVPIITLAVSYSLYLLMKKRMPKTLSFLCGGR